MCKRIVTVMLAVMLVAMLPACAPDAQARDGGPQGAAPVKTMPPVPGAADAVVKPVAFMAADTLQGAVANALDAFSLDLFQHLAQADAGHNVFISPVSVWLALGMTCNGASGTTAEGMMAALHATGLSLSDLNRDNAGLTGLLTAAEDDARLALANSIWMRGSFKSAVNRDFIERTRQYYGSEAQALDFGDASAVKAMNRWVEENTGGTIRDMVKAPINPNTMMFLISAIHFKAPWKEAFDPKMTRDGAFISSTGVGVQARFMCREEGVAGYFDEAVTAVRIPYDSGRLEMVAVMPVQQKLGDFIAELTPGRLEEVAGKCEESSMTLLFPAFKTAYEATLNDALTAMGMGEAFGMADFSALSKIYGKELYISKVRHKSFIEVNEEGAEAGAGTSVEIQWKGLPMALEFNRAFVYWIRDTKTGAVLFMGALEEP